MARISAKLGGGILFSWLLFLGACEFGEGDASIPGDALGTYQVIARLTNSSCGPGALGSQDLWEFEVKLSQADRQLFWLNGDEPVAGRLAADGASFSLESSGQSQLIEPEPGYAGCALVRTDRASGVLEVNADDALDVRAFSGLMSYGFVPVSGSDCSPAIGVEGGFYTLPCEIQYAMTATRIAAP